MQIVLFCRTITRYCVTVLVIYIARLGLGLQGVLILISKSIWTNRKFTKYTCTRLI